jgi:hypothetical protein
MLHPLAEFSEYESSHCDDGRSAHSGEDDIDGEGDTAHTQALVPVPTILIPQVAHLKYFLLLDFNGTLIHFSNPKILAHDKGMKKGESKARPGLEKF